MITFISYSTGIYVFSFDNFKIISEYTIKPQEEKYESV